MDPQKRLTPEELDELMETMRRNYPNITGCSEKYRQKRAKELNLSLDATWLKISQAGTELYLSCKAKNQPLSPLL